MGYTHYWRHGKIDNQTFVNISNAASKVCDIAKKKMGIRTAYECDMSSKPPLFNSECIRLNGINDGGHETFMLNINDDGFNFCKTAQKPYDVVVTAILCLAEYYSCDTFGVTSDGEPEEWQQGLNLPEW